MIINGKEIANKIILDLKKQFENLKFQANLAVIYVGENAVSEQFLKIKKRVAEEIGVNFKIFKIENSSQEEIEKQVVKIANDENIHGVILQLPIPENLDTEKILKLIPPKKDVDVLNPATKKVGFLTEPVALAIWKILETCSINLSQSKIVLVGYGKLVGEPVAKLLNKKNIQPIVLNKNTSQENFLKEIKLADIIISGAGVPQLIKPEMIKFGITLIDAGTSESGGKVVGDIDLSCAEKANFFSKTPGGVGPIAVSMIYENLLKLISNETA